MSILPHGLTVQEIRILQEFRRQTVDELALDEIRAIKHPVGGGESPAWSLVEKGFLAADESRQKVRLTDQAREFLAYEPVPGTESS